MGKQTYCEHVKQTYLTHAFLQDTLSPPEDDPGQALDDILANLTADIIALSAIDQTRYLHEQNHIPKVGNLHVAWEYAQDPALHPEFVKLLRVPPLVFNVILELIKDNPIFHNTSNAPQTPVDIQLSVALYRLGRYGNAASIEDVARVAGIGVGTVELFTGRVFSAIESLHDQFLRPLTPEEKEIEKRWIDEHLGFVGLWREGWVMYDGTIVVLYAKPGLNGEAYYTRKGNYGLNVQVCPNFTWIPSSLIMQKIGNVPSNLCIVDCALGMTGSVHDSVAFEHTAAYKYPEENNEDGGERKRTQLTAELIAAKGM
jgi:hypothetical protein